jgi:hypothetical protein
MIAMPMEEAMCAATRLTCRTEDPVDALTRILHLIARCSISLGGVEVTKDDGMLFAADFTLVEPLPFDADHLAERVRQIPSVSAATCYMAYEPDAAAL